MKKYQYIFVRALMIILVCMATSCGNDDTDEPPVDDMLKFGEWTYISKDGSLLNSVNLTIHKVPENETLSKEGKVSHTYAIDSYEDLAFMMYFQQDFVTDYIAANGQRENFEEVIRRAIKYEWNKWLYIKKRFGKVRIK